MDAIIFTSPWHMAKILVRRPHDLSTVHAMIANEFGFAPPMDEIATMRERHASKEQNIRRRFGDMTINHSIEYSNARHELAMECGSKSLAEALQAARQP